MEWGLRYAKKKVAGCHRRNLSYRRGNIILAVHGVHCGEVKRSGCFDANRWDGVRRDRWPRRCNDHSRSDKIDDRDVYVVSAVRLDDKSERLYFDVENGLLRRRICYLRSLVGTIPQQYDFEDYREA